MVSPSSRRAWIEISVPPGRAWYSPRSPSSRRAWIEIFVRIGCCNRWYVALLAEGVDRNNFNFAGVRPNPAVALLAEGVDRNLFTDLSRDASDCWSPSSRRAWIEIPSGPPSGTLAAVALLAEGVDRNTTIPRLFQKLLRRPPRGGRG